MSEDFTEEEKLAIQQAYIYIEEKLWGGESKDKVVKALVEYGYPEDMAADMVDDREEAIKEYKRTPEGRSLMANAYRRHMISGLLWVTGGVTVTWVTYALAEGGGWYFVFFGAIIFGFIDFIRGLVGWLNNK